MEEKIMSIDTNYNSIVEKRGELTYLIVMPLFQAHPDDTYYFPLGVPYISSTMKEAGYKVYTLNLNHKVDPYKVLRERIRHDNIDVVMTGALSPQYAQMKVIFDIAKEENPEIITIAGGGIVSGDPKTTMEALETANYGIIGEGEETVVELCRTLQEGGNLSKVNGIVFGSKNNYTITKARPEIVDIDSIPFPDCEGFDYEKYLEICTVHIHGQVFGNAATILTSRSCPFNCTFCFRTIGKKYRVRSLDNVFEELDYLIEKYDIKFVGQVDDLFSNSYTRIKEFCERIENYNLPWQTIFRIPDINEKNIMLLKKANCKMINTGIESADNSILKSIGKGTTIEQIEDALDVAYKMKMPVNGTFIFGDANETAETAKKTLDWWQNNLKYGIAIKMIKVFPGTALYHIALEKNVISDPIDFLKQGCPPVNVSKLSEEELGDLVTKITVLPYQVGAKLHSVELLNSYDPLNLHIKGDCDYCGKSIETDKYRPFALGRINCPHCQGGHVVSLPDTISETIISNITDLTKSGKVALWGMADYAIEFTSEVTKQCDNLLLIDLSEEKQLMHINGKEVQAPSSIKEQNITNVIVLVPDFLESVKHTVEQYFKCDNVQFFSIYDLFKTDFFKGK